MRRPQLNALLVGGLVLATLLGVMAGRFVNSSSGAGLAQALKLDSPRPVPAFSLTQGNGQPLVADDLRGRWHLVFFGFTHCPDICPSTMALLKQALAQAPEAVRANTRVLFVSVDPERDRPEVLQAYVRHFDPGFIGATGDIAQLEGFASALSAAFIRVELDEGYTMDHSTALVLLDPQVRVAAFFPAPHDPIAIARDLGTLAAGS